MGVFVLQLLVRFGVRGVDDDAFDRTHHYALRFVMVTDALSAQRRIDDVVLLAKRNRLVRADWFADVAVDAGVEDLEGHARQVYMGMRLLCEATKVHKHKHVGGMPKKHRDIARLSVLKYGRAYAESGEVTLAAFAMSYIVL
jgi:hypothetical protein